MKLQRFVLFIFIKILMIEPQDVSDEVTVQPITPISNKPKDWPGQYNNGSNNTRDALGKWLLQGNNGFKEKNHEYEGYDGWYNNIAYPDLGAIDRPLLRRSPATYEDGSYTPAGTNRPNALVLSDTLLSGPIGSKSSTGKSALFVFFGQQIVEEILDAQRPACPPEYINIRIPEGHHYRVNQPNHTELPLLRTRFDASTGFSPNNPRQQLNEITPFIDGGLFYGISKQWADQLRTYPNGTIDPDGRLASTPDGLFPAYNTEKLPMANPPPPFYHSHYVREHETAKVSRFFKLGNPRGNENSFLLTFGVLWFRWHNYLAKNLRELRPNWSSDKIFNEARKLCIATYQKIVFYDWLPELLQIESMPKYESYNPSVDPQIDQLFQSAAFRFGHTLVVPGVYLRDFIRNNNKCRTKFDTWGKNAIRTCNIFWRPQEPMLNTTERGNAELIDIDRILMGMSVQLSEKEDHKIVEDLRGNVFGPLEFPRRDLMAINIQRGRDHGNPDFNTAREAFGLPRVAFEHFNHLEQTVLDAFKTLHNNSMDDVDVWVGGILETKNAPGELFSAIIWDQFLRIRNGDRFWFENKANKFFDDEEIGRIRSITIYDVIMAVTKMDPDDIPKEPFRVAVQSDAALINACGLKNSTCESRTNSFSCYHLEQLNATNLNESCLQGDSYDYFSNSELSFILTFSAAGAFLIGTIGFVWALLRIKEKQILKLQIREDDTIRQSSIRHQGAITDHMVIVSEWIGDKIGERRVVVVLKESLSTLEVQSPTGSILRAIDFSKYDSLELYSVNDEPYLVIKCRHNYDLVLHFDSDYTREHFLNHFHEFIQRRIPNITAINIGWKMCSRRIVSRQQRQELVEKFYRVVFAQAFKIEYSKKELLKIDQNVEKEIVNTELTISEFAEAISMRADDGFVKRMFHVCDKDKDGFITFRDFVDLLIIFANGTEEEKAKLLFHMYDVNDVGYLTEDNFNTMIKSFLATVGGKVEESKIQTTVKTMLQRAGLHRDDRVDFHNFMKLFADDVKHLSRARLNFKGVVKNHRESIIDEARDTLENIYESYNDVKERFQGEITNTDPSPIDRGQEEYINITRREIRSRFAFIKYIELRSKEIFWYTLYALVGLCIFAERAYYYAIETEHSGLRLITGYGVMMTRGAASAMMFTYSSLLVTMCRNTITFLRDTCLNQYFPFDSMVDFHKYIAYWAFLYTLIHVIGHAFNFYHIATQPANDLTCFFRNFFHSTHELPKFHYWCWQTLTGFTGVTLTLLWFVIYIFAQNFVRRKIYNWFWYTHSMYPLHYILMVLHGIARLIQPPFFHYFLLGPVILFALDKIVSLSRKKIEIPVIRAEILPSNVTMLEFRKPENFQYKSGQWVRIACFALNKNEYHPFTLTSSPDELNLTVHIRAVGPWTTQIRTLYDNTIKDRTQFSRIFLDGPYGEGHQDWNRFEVSILIGGGIGVTPFASILKDVVAKSTSNQTVCKKVYFIWVSRTQKQFEWLVDSIRKLESRDTKNVISCHIFITQFFEKFDLRMIFLYICERHYQRISNRSLFTNLRAVTHFGRPSFLKFFNTVASLHSNVKSVGIFSCGPPSMTNEVERSCNVMNTTGDLKFEHSYKNF